MPVRIKGGFSTVGCQKNKTKKRCALQLVLLFFLTLSFFIFFFPKLMFSHCTK